MSSGHSKNSALTTQPKLPTPDAVFVSKQARFEIYRAKDLYKKSWRHPGLHQLAAIARTSYHRYGSRSLFDKYDRKAAIYLARVQYYKKQSEGKPLLVNEWLSVRMVPGNGEFNGVGEPELFALNGISVAELLQKKMNVSRSEFWSHIISDSRLCGIHPYTLDSHRKITRLESNKHEYTPHCMALMQLQFMRDYPPSKLPFEFVTAIIRPEIRDKVLTVQKGKTLAKPHFVPAHTTLGLSKKDKVIVNREAYAYQFPKYWLNMHQLKKLLNKLLKNKQISQKTFDYYLDSYSIDSMEGEIKLSKLLTAKGKLAGGKITGPKLRSLIDKYVADTTELQIIPIQAWRKGFLAMVSKVGIKIPKNYPKLT